MMNLKEQLQSDLKTAMREGDVERRDTLRMVISAIKQVEVDQRVELDDAGIQSVLAKQAKQRRESIEDAERAGRKDLVDQEHTELVVIESYLPQMMNEDEIRTSAAAVIAELDADGVQDTGRVMGRLMPELKGRADGALVSQVVRDLLQS